MPNSDKSIVLCSSKSLFITRLIAAIVLGIAALYWLYRGEIVLVIIFSFVTMVNLVVALIINRRQINITGDLLTLKLFAGGKTIEMRSLKSAGYVSRMGIFLTDRQNQKLSIPTMLNKKDFAFLLSYIRPYVMITSVQCDEALVRLFDKYNIDKRQQTK